MYISSVMLLIFLHLADNFPITRWEKKVMCAEIPIPVLENLLGGAFNPRYMSIDPPIEQESSSGGKRGVSYPEDFYVDEHHLEQVATEPAWEVNLVEAAKHRYGLQRKKRGVDYKQQWQCQSKIEWTDLGPEYFPRYLRSVRCLCENCWFGVYKCQPRSFTVRVLRKKKDFCVGNDNRHKVGIVGLPKDLKALWVWEERAVTFCCDCTRV